MRRPFVDGNALETLTRFTHRHSSLFLEHRTVPYPGSTVEILTKEFAARGGGSMLRTGLSCEPRQLLVAGTHNDVLTAPGPISEALMELFAELGMLPEV